MTTIIDISEWQVPGAINYDVLASQVDHVIVRVQYGSNYEDKHYKTHITELQKRGVPVAVYAWIRGVSIADMEQEATIFYNRAKQINPTFWWLDVEEQSMGDMRAGANAFRNKLKALGAGKIGAYIANHLYSQFNVEVANFDAVWIPAYGKDTGAFNGTIPDHQCDLHQYTQNGRLNGYSGSLDMNRLTGTKPLSYFTNKTEGGNIVENQATATNNLKERDVVTMTNLAYRWVNGEKFSYIDFNSVYTVIGRDGNKVRIQARDVPERIGWVYDWDVQLKQNVNILTAQPVKIKPNAKWTDGTPVNIPATKLPIFATCRNGDQLRILTPDNQFQFIHDWWVEEVK